VRANAIVEKLKYATHLTPGRNRHQGSSHHFDTDSKSNQGLVGIDDPVLQGAQN
jgi:hypothetical protein